MNKYATLRFGMPIGILLLFLSLSALSYYYNIVTNKEHVLRDAISDALSKSERLARTAQIELSDNKAELESDLGIESTDLRITALAVVHDDGTIQATHRLDWAGKNIAQTVAEFDMQRLKEVTKGRLPDVKILEGANRRIRVLSPFVEAGTKSQIRSLVSGAVFLEYDLTLEDAEYRWQAQKRWMYEASIGLAIAAFLCLILYRRVAVPLLRIEEAGRRLSQAPDTSIAVPASGPLELRNLAEGFNAMAQNVVSARRDIERQSAKLAAIFDSAMDAIITVDEQQRVTMINGAALEMFGYTQAQALGQPLEVFLPERFRASHASHLKTFSQMGEAHQRVGQRGTLRALRSNGEEFPIRASISHLRVREEELFTAIVQDVTKELEDEASIHQLTTNLELLVEQRTAKLNEATRSLELRQRELSAARDELQTIFDAAAVGIMLCKDRYLVRCNPQSVAMLGYEKPDDLNGKPLSNLFAKAAGFEEPVETLYTQLSNTDNAVIETRMVRKDGAQLWVSINARQLTEGPMQGMMLAFLEDVSLKHAASDALLEAKAAAESATRSKSNFLANMSHEIRTPMNAIIGMSHLALKTDLDKKQRNYIEKVHRSAESLLGIINDILDFSKIEAGKMEVESVEFNLDDVMDNLAHLVGIKAEEKGLELLFNMAPEVPTNLVGDPLRLGQVLINLGNNATKFTESGEIIIGMEKMADVGEDVLLHFWVRDSGIGMTQEQCEKLFQSFSQADASTTRKYGGTGLGLAISKSLVEAMHGKIWVESVPGQGSTFHFHARFGVQANPQTRRMFSAEELLGLRLLVVDDNSAAREILSTVAKTFGLNVDAASDGPSTFRCIADSAQRGVPYDLILMDWKMPGLDGVQVVRRLKTENLIGIPVIIMVTALSREEAMASFKQSALKLPTLLTKPVTPSALLESIGDCLGKGIAITTRKEARAEDSAEHVKGLHGARVLLVEDNDMNQELAMELLKNAGIEVILAKNGQEALDVLAIDTSFDGILMDCQMPVMDGYVATREIRKLPFFQDLPIIAMTANAMVGDREKVLEAGMSDHIAKPLNVQAMFATMAKWIHPALSPNHSPFAHRKVSANPMGLRNADLFQRLNLAGIDTQFGLKTALNKEDFYLRLLRKFLAGQSDFAALFSSALAGSDPTAAQRYAHTLRGSAATIGAAEVQDAAQALEQACKRDLPQGEIAALLKRVLQALQPVLQCLKALPDEEIADDVAHPDAKLDMGALSEVRAQLIELLERGDSAALDLCEKEEALFNAAYPGHWKRVIDNVNKFDFEAALAALLETA